MAFEQEQREALYLLQGIENGSLRAADAAHVIQGADPALVYLVLTWIRSRYGGDHPAAEGVLGRLVELTSKHAVVKAKMRECGSPIAGEMSGHIFFGERWYGFDDATYTAARMLEILSRQIDERSAA